MKTIVRIVAPLLILGLAGCIASGPLAQAPVVEGDAARVVFVRPYAVVGMAATFAVSVDGLELYGLDNDQHVVFSVPPGERIIGVRTPDPVVGGRVTSTTTIKAEAGSTYYFRVGPGRIDRITEAEGQQFVQQTTPAKP